MTTYCKHCGNWTPCDCEKCEECRNITMDPVYLDGNAYCEDCAVEIAEPSELPEWVRVPYQMQEFQNIDFIAGLCGARLGVAK